MIMHLTRKLQDEAIIWLRQRVGVTPVVHDIEPMPPYDPGSVPTSVRFSLDWIDYTTGRVHKVGIHITETVCER